MPDAVVSQIAALRWRANRLRCMTTTELAFRIGRALKNEAERVGIGGPGGVPPADLRKGGTTWLQAPDGVAAAPCLEAADRIVAGRIDVFALRDIDLGSPPRWNRDPKTGIEAPLSFGKRLDYRDPQLVGDIKYLWEPNRHQHLVTLAQAWALSRRERYLDAVRRHLDSWFTACPPGRGPNWASALEPALRLISWSATWQLLGGAEGPLFAGSDGAAFRRRWLDSVYHHQQFVRGHFSLHSSANNHLIGEAAGLFIGTATWPHWARSAEWRSTARAMLEREALLQNAPDGVNREQAVSYHRFVLELLLLPLLAARAAGAPFSARYGRRLEAMLGFLAAIMDVGGNVPGFGDADDAAVLRLSDDCPYRSLLATGAVLFRRGDLKVKAGVLDDKTRWLLGARAAADFDALPATGHPMRRAFPDGGYYVLGCEFETPAEIRLVADAGPLGYRSIAAHGHADALSFTLSVGGVPLLVDPGTYAYHTEPLWRAHFRGTGAHNTLRVDGCDQSEPGGNFMWLAKAGAGCNVWHATAETDVFEGWHDGYLRLADPVMHVRRIELDKRARRIVIEDRLKMRGAHEIELFFHAAEDCRVSDDGGGRFRLSCGAREATLTLPAAADASTRLHCGSLDPIAGWVSPRFDERRPAVTVHWHACLTGDAVLRTEIAC
ncbi:MAG TPA: alginate lyase family protein [Rhodocyclaceae bacterium]